MFLLFDLTIDVGSQNWRRKNASSKVFPNQQLKSRRKINQMKPNAKLRRKIHLLDPLYVYIVIVSKQTEGKNYTCIYMLYTIK